jgi:zinc protease
MIPVHHEVLDNGLTVILQEMDSAEVVALQAWVGVGSADETEREAGLAHVHEHMLFKGTSRRKVGEIAQAVEGAGGEINAWTSLDQTVYHLVLASRFFDVGLDVLADALQHSAFDAEELAREKEVILEEIKRGEDQPGRVATQELFQLAYKVHPYRRPVIGTRETVSALSREDVLSFYRRWYVPENVVLVIVGDIRTGKALEKVRRAFGSFATSAVPARHGLFEPPQEGTRARVRREPIEETYFDLAVHVPSVEHPDVAALDLLASILGQGESARLTQSVKRRRGLVSDIYAFAYTPRDPGVFTVGGSGPPRKVRDALRATLVEAGRLTRELVSEDEIAKARTLVESQAVYDKETAQGMARKFGFYQSTVGDLAFERRYYEAVARATPRDLLEVAQRYLTPERVSIAVVQPEKTRGLITEEECLAAAEELRRPVRKASRQARGGHAPIVRVELPSGAILLTRRDSRVPIVAMRAVWRGGLRYERPNVNGITNFIAEVLTQGTEERSAAEVAHAVDAMAGNLSAFAGRNSFGVRGEFLSRTFDRGLELFAECIARPSFAEPEIERQRQLQLEEIRVLDDNPSGLAFRLLARALYPRHPYRMHGLGTAEAVRRLGRRELVRFYRRNYPVSRMVLSVVGDLDPARIVERVARVFDIPIGVEAQIREPDADPPLRAPVIVEETREKRQAHIVLGFNGTTLTSKDRYALEVLSTILSGQGGRLFYELRDRRSLAYSVSSASIEGLEPGYFAVYMGTSPEKIGEGVDGILEELRKVRDAKVSTSELRRAQRYLIGTHAISLQRLSPRAATLAFDECYGLGYDHTEHYPKYILAVTREDVEEVARRYLDLDRYALSIVRPSAAPGVATLGLAARAETR